MKLVVSTSNYLLRLTITGVLGSAALLSASAPQASAYYLDFETAPDGTKLDSFALDGSSGQTINETTYGTHSSFLSIGEIWSGLGISIMGYDNNYVTDVLNNHTPKTGGRTLGLFQSECRPGKNGIYAGGVSAERYGTPCVGDDKNWQGDNDLATGTYYKYINGNKTLDAADNIVYSSIPQGNLLIFEEKAGNYRPDDTVEGGTFVFDFSQFDGDWAIDEMSVVDDAQGWITYFYEDGTNSQEEIDIAGENEVQFFSQAQHQKISKLAVQFDNSGGIGGIRLKEIKPASIPEPATLAGLVAIGTGMIITRRRNS
ncbi:MAG: PEP-CTERM sorting domain-containing protein [Leptolyngbyaceae cyanobacterium]